MRNIQDANNFWWETKSLSRTILSRSGGTLSNALTRGNFAVNTASAQSLPGRKPCCE